MSLSRSNATSRNRWFDDYIRLTLARDVPELKRIRQDTALPQILNKLAGQTAQILNSHQIATDLGFGKDLVGTYLKLLEAVFLVHRLPAWGTTLTARSSSNPKIHVMDAGVAARLLRLSPEKLTRRHPTSLTELGHLLETFVVGELMRQLSWLDGFAGVGHWRTWDGDEVDLVVERDDGVIVAFEVKANSRIPSTDLNPMRKLRDKMGGAFLAGVAMYLGQRRV